MRILVITDLFPSLEKPSSGIFVKNSLIALSEIADVCVLVPVHKGAKVKLQNSVETVITKPESTNFEKLKVILIPYTPPKIIKREFLRTIKILPTISNTVKSLWNTQKFDIFLSYFLVPNGFIAARLAKHYNVPSVVVGLGSDVNLYKNYFILKNFVSYTLKKANGVILNANGLVDGCIEQKAAKEKIKVVYFGVDKKIFPYSEEMNSDNSIPKFLMVAKLSEVKQPQIFAQSLKNLFKSGFSFQANIVGDGPLREKFETYANEAGYASQIKFHGYLSQPEVARLFKQATATVLTSRAEGLPFVLLESMSTGTPVVASNLPGIKEIVTPGVNGLLVESGDVNGFSSALVKITTMKLDRKTISDSVSDFTWDIHAQNMLSFLKHTKQSLFQEFK